MLHTMQHKQPGPISPAQTLQDQIDRHIKNDGIKMGFDTWFDLEYKSVKLTMGQLDYYAMKHNLRKAWQASRDNI